MKNYLNYNGKIVDADKPIIKADNRSFRYGDGIFETIKVINGNIQLPEYHFERLFTGINLLKFDLPKHLTAEFLTNQIFQLCRKNHHEKLGRVRLIVFRGNGGLYDPDNHLPNFIIQSWQLPFPDNSLNKNGLLVDIYPYARKSIDVFSNLKSNNFLPYAMGALYAKQQKLNDCLILNSNGSISDSTIANLFIIKNTTVITPPLSDGCVSGVMRRYLLEKLNVSAYQLEERSLGIEDIRTADEVFLSNSINGIRWVEEFRDVKFGHSQAMKIYTSLFNGSLLKM